jgi:Eukaryotic DNA topoisomerase I, catalytic core
VLWCVLAAKNPSDQLFETFDATDLNRRLKELMDGLSVKVFRTYNASVVLDRLLYEQEEVGADFTVDERKADYDRANKEVSAPPQPACPGSRLSESVRRSAPQGVAGRPGFPSACGLDGARAASAAPDMEGKHVNVRNGCRLKFPRESLV